MTEIANWKVELAQALRVNDGMSAQAASCEQELLAGLQEDGIKAAMQFVDDLLGRGKRYLDCKFGGSETPQAQAAWNDLLATVANCSLAHVGKLLRKDYGGFITGVLNCVGAKLIGDSVSDSTGAQYAPSTRNRCGQR